MRHEHEGELPCILHKTRGFLMLYACVLYHDDPLPDRVINMNCMTFITRL